jgi:hypothetical protein
MCTLAICKPAIRRTAHEGDWVVGIGSKSTDWGDLSNHVVYAMRVSKVLSMAEYDEYCQRSFPRKVPAWDSTDFRRRVGDCIYDYSNGPEPEIRASVHNEGNRKTDLGGRNVLLSDHFYYFGRQAVALPKSLWPVRHGTQGHKSRANDPFATKFVAWIERLGRPSNVVIAEPQLKERILALNPSECRSQCAARSREEDIEDREIC